MIIQTRCWERKRLRPDSHYSETLHPAHFRSTLAVYYLGILTDLFLDETTTLKTGAFTYFSGGETNDFFYSRPFFTFLIKKYNSFQFKPPEKKSDENFSIVFSVYFWFENLKKFFTVNVDGKGEENSFWPRRKTEIGFTLKNTKHDSVNLSVSWKTDSVCSNFNVDRSSVRKS